MKKFLSAAFLLSVFLSLYSIDVPIYPKDWAILRDSGKVYLEHENFWVPQYKEAQAALYAAYQHIQDLNSGGNISGIKKAEIKRIAENWKLFRVQFAGLIIEGKKKIFCNFFDRRMKAGEWQKEQIIAEDTPYFYWSILFDPVSKTFSRFKSGSYEE